jgi:transposase-like protein
MKCPKCQSGNNVKNGTVRNLQRHKCKDCGCNYTISFAQNAEKERKRRFALSMYLEGLGFHSIGRLLGVSHVSALNWVRKYGRELDVIRNPKPTKMVELDELHTYIGHKKTGDGYGLVLIEKPGSTWISLLGTEAQKQG